MMRTHLFLAIALAAVLTPGPAMLAILGHAVARGARATIPVVLGNVAGAVVLMGASIAGLAAVLAAVPGALIGVRFGGAAYLGWLGIQSLRAHADRAVTPASGGFLRGLIIAISNPKALLFYAAVLPQFVDASLAPGPQFVLLASTFAGLELAVTTGVTFAAHGLAPLLRGPTAARRIQRAGGLVMVTAALLLALA